MNINNKLISTKYKGAIFSMAKINLYGITVESGDDYEIRSIRSEQARGYGYDPYRAGNGSRLRFEQEEEVFDDMYDEENETLFGTNMSISDSSWTDDSQ